MNETQSESLQKPVESVKPTGIARRRLLRAGLAAAPVVLAVSGRSAMAGTNVVTCAKGLSPLAWNSVSPNGTCTGSSHTVEGNTLGLSPGYWKPNCGGNGNVFSNGSWPSPILPFKGYDPAKIYKNISCTNTSWASGTKFSKIFTSSSETRSFSVILINDNGSSLNWHLAAAYLNAVKYPTTYALRPQEVISLAGNMLGGRTVTDGEIKAFLDQTWA